MCPGNYGGTKRVRLCVYAPGEEGSIKTEGGCTLCENTLSRLKVNASQRQRRERAISMQTIITQAIPNIYPHCYLSTIWRMTNKPYLTL